MAAFRTLQPILRQTSRNVARLPQPRRFLNTETAPLLATAHATVTGGRAQGHVEAPTLKLDLGMPKSLGGTGKHTNPEELFAAGYGACFQGAMNATATSMGLKMPEKAEDSIVESTVYLVGDPKALDMGIRVDMKVKIRGMKKEDVEKVVEKTKTVCPYSRATQGNVITNVKVEIL